MTVRARAASLAAALALLGLVAPAEGQEVETLIVPVGPSLTGPGPDTLTATSYDAGETLAIVFSGVITGTTPLGPVSFDPFYCFGGDNVSAGCGTPDSNGATHFRRLDGSGQIMVFNGGAFFGDGSGVPPPFSDSHRYEVTAQLRGAGPLRFRLGPQRQGATFTGSFTVEITRTTPPSCDGRPATIDAVPGFPTFGTEGVDVIVGTEGDDQLFGLGGRDVICGLGGNDVISGNRGVDRLFGGLGNDQITGGDDRARDFLFGEDGQDRLSGGKGNDVLDGGPGVDRMIGGPGDDRLFVSDDRLVIISDGRLQGDDLLGGPDDDLADYSQLPGPVRVDLRRSKQRGGEILSSIENVRGTPGNDRLTGNAEFNVLEGEGGNDRVNVRDRGSDTVKGGPGFDTCLVDFETDPDDPEGFDDFDDCERRVEGDP